MPVKRIRTAFVGARLTPKQCSKLEAVAIANDLTVSAVVSALVDRVEIEDLLVPELVGIRRTQNDADLIRQDSASAVL